MCVHDCLQVERVSSAAGGADDVGTILELAQPTKDKEMNKPKQRSSLLIFLLLGVCWGRTDLFIACGYTLPSVTPCSDFAIL